MTAISILLCILLFLAAVNIWLTITKKSSDDFEEFRQKLILLENDLVKIDSLMRDEFRRNREEGRISSKENRTELTVSFNLLSKTLMQMISNLSTTQKNQFESFSQQLSDSFKENRSEQNESLKSFEESLAKNVIQLNELQRQKFDELYKRFGEIKSDTENKLKEIRETVENKLSALQQENSKKLEEMRVVVDEKLHETVEKRFNESFKLISDRLEQVHKGLGEMQSLASGVGDLKKVLTNVKTRGNLGEIQLGSILQQILSPEQYEQNVVIKANSQERVEFAIKLPAKNQDDKALLLPIDSKFPTEDYQRLLEVYETGGSNGKDIEFYARQFETAVRKNAKDIRNKYICPPKTTDFAIMFVPTEGLYAEILRRTGLFESLQRDCKITVVGPTNLVAFLSSLQMGFRTLAIEKRSGEVWEILGAVKTEFGRFGAILEKTKKKLQEATNVIDDAERRSRSIERKLRNVQELPSEDSSIENEDNVPISQ